LATDPHFLKAEFELFDSGQEILSAFLGSAGNSAAGSHLPKAGIFRFLKELEIVYSFLGEVLFLGGGFQHPLAIHQYDGLTEVGIQMFWGFINWVIFIDLGISFFFLTVTHPAQGGGSQFQMHMCSAFALH
jgi:hypothetical protein